MQKKIKRLQQDIFETKSTEVVFSDTSIFFTVDSNTSYNGSFQINSRDYKKVRGMIYTSTFRMKTKVVGFEDEKVYVPFTFNANGLTPGERIEGKFIIFTEAGEYEINFCASVNVTTIESKYGSFSNFEEFRDLAYVDYKSAFNCFVSSKFRNIIPEGKDDILNLYDGLNRFEITEHAMEEFLIALNLKKSVQITLLEDNKKYHSSKDSFSDGIDIIADGWGYLPIDVKVDANFIEIKTNSFSTLDFYENSFHFEYLVDVSKLHDGKNYAKISFVTPYETKNLDIVIDNGHSKQVNDLNTVKTIQRLKIEIVKDYIDYRSEKISVSKIKDELISKLEKLYALTGNDPVYKMFEAHVLKDAGDNDLASEILNEYGTQYCIPGKNDILWGYYFYLASCIRNDISYSIQASDEVKKIYSKNKNSWQLVWIDLQLESYLMRNSDEKLELIESKWNDGAVHSILLLEAYNIIKEDPSLIENINEFLLNVLIFAKRRGIITESVARYIMIVSSRIRKYNTKIFGLLEECYNVLKSKDALIAICRYLIIGQKTDYKYFKWYEMGVNSNINISNLYEYYLYSLDKNNYTVLPNSVYLYFSNPVSLDYKTKAFVYSDIVKNRSRYPEIFDRIKNNIIKFTRQQLLLNKINPDLNFLYQNFLPIQDLNREEYNALADLYYTYEITVEADNLAQIIVLHKGLVSPNVVSIIDGKANVKLYTKDDQILLQDKLGRVFIKTIPFKVKKIVGDEYMRKIICEKCPRHIGVLLSTCYPKVVNEDNVIFYKNIIDADGVQEYLRKESRKALLWHYYVTENHLEIGQLLSHINVGRLNREERSLYIGILLSENRLKGVFNTLKEYGYEGVDPELLLEFCDSFLVLTNYEEDDMLNDISIYLFRMHVYSEHIMKYLIDKYCGMTSSMLEIWDLAHNDAKKTNHIEERILIQMLFCEEVTDEEDIFDNYYNSNPNQNIVDAYLSYKSFSYFVYNNELESRFFKYIEKEYEKGKKINASCQLAVLKYYSDLNDYEENVKCMLNSFLQECAKRNLVFGFFRKYAKKFLNNLSFLNRYIVSYQGSEKGKVTIYYSITRQGEKTKEFTEEILPEHYYTYYIKDFILFKGEVLHYYIVEEIGDNSRVVETCNISQKEFLGNETGRFLAINEILGEEFPEVKLNEYEKKTYLVNQIFQIQ